MDLFDYGNFCRAREKGIGMLLKGKGDKIFGERGGWFLGQDVGWIKGKRLSKVNFSPGCKNL